MPSLFVTWDLDGLVSEQRYYCQTTPIDANSLPTPKMVLDGEVREYTDLDVIEGETYHIRVGSFRGDVEKISSEVVIVATAAKDDFWPYVVTLLNFENGLIDATGKRTYSAFGGANTTATNPIWGDASLDLQGASAKSINTPHSADLNIGGGDFTIEISLTAQSITDGYHSIMGKRNGYGSAESFTIYRSNKDLSIDFYYDFGGYRQSVTAANVFSQTNTKYDVQIIKNGLVLIVALNGVQKTSFNLSSHIANSSAPLHIGQASFNEGSVFGGLIDEIRITKGIARPVVAKTEPFPTL